MARCGVTDTPLDARPLPCAHAITARPRAGGPRAGVPRRGARRRGGEDRLAVQARTGAQPCEPRLDTTRFTPASERIGTERPRRPRRRRIDCFYVYPTVSDQPAPAADRSIDPELLSIALYQAGY